jgi:hypothetical protein
LGGGGPRYLQRNGDGRRQFRAIGTDSVEGEEEGGEAELLGWSGKQGAARNGSGRRWPWWLLAGHWEEEHREEEERANGETSEGEKGREEAARRRHQGGAPCRPGASRRWQHRPQALPRKCLRWKKGKVAENPLPLEGFLENSKTELVLELSKF